MALNVFGGGPSDVTSDSAGNIIGGVTMKVYTAALGGQQVTELYDTTGDPLSGVVTSEAEGDDEGRVTFQASDQYQILYLDAGYGMRWAVPAREAFSAAYTALGKSEAAVTAAQKAEALATEAGTKADLAFAEVDAKLGFDITKLSPTFVTQLRGDPQGVVQSFARDPLSGDYYASQAIGQIGGTTNLVVTHYDANGTPIDQCTFEGGGHGSTTAIERDGQNVWLWFRWTYDSTSSGYTNRMVRAKYQPGLTVKRNDPAVLDVMDVSDDLLVNYEIDQAADRIALRVTPGGTNEQYLLYRLSDYKANRNTPLAMLGPYTWSEADDGPYQGHCTIDGHLYMSRGNVDQGNPCTITRIDWETGEQTVINVTDVGRIGSTWPGGRNENEGVTVWRGQDGTPSLLFGKAVGSYGYRQALVYAFSPPAADFPAGESLRAALTSFQSGKVIVPGGSGEITSTPVRFKWEFPGVPDIVVTPATSSPGGIVKGASFGNETPQGFTAYINRTSASATTVHWHAYYGPGMNGTTP